MAWAEATISSFLITVISKIQILVRDSPFKRLFLIRPTHYIFFKISYVGIKNDVSRHLRY